MSTRSERVTLGSVARLRGAWDRWWVVVAVLAVTVASDYKFRVRDKTLAVSGRPDPYVLLEIGIYAAVAVLVLSRTRSLPNLRSDRLVALFACWAGYMGLSAAWSPYHALSLVRACQLAVVGGLLFAIGRLATREHFHRLAHGQMALVSLSVLHGLVWPAPPVSQLVADRFTWLSLHPVSSANWTAVALVIVVGYLSRRQSSVLLWPVWLYGLVAAVLTYGLLASKTRGSVSGAVLGGLLCCYLAISRARRRDLVAVLGGLGLLIALVGTSTITSYLARGESAERLTTLNSRTTLWSEAFDAVRESPVIGQGLGATRGIFQETTGLGGAHNAFINVLVDGGLIGVTLWLAVLVTLATRLRSLRRTVPDQRLATAVASGILVMLLVNSVFYEGLGSAATLPSSWLAVLAGWASVLSRRPVRPPRAVQPRSAVPIAEQVR